MTPHCSHLRFLTSSLMLAGALFLSLPVLAPALSPALANDPHASPPPPKEGGDPHGGGGGGGEGEKEKKPKPPPSKPPWFKSYHHVETIADCIYRRDVTFVFDEREITVPSDVVAKGDLFYFGEGEGKLFIKPEPRIMSISIETQDNRLYVAGLSSIKLQEKKDLCLAYYVGSFVRAR